MDDESVGHSEQRERHRRDGKRRSHRIPRISAPVISTRPVALSAAGGPKRYGPSRETSAAATSADAANAASGTRYEPVRSNARPITSGPSPPAMTNAANANPTVAPRQRSPK